jgi:toxin ParE1/3/4
LELLLSKRQFEYRYLVEGNYKIIYWIETDFIKIAAVFDRRQNEKKIKRLCQL